MQTIYFITIDLEFHKDLMKNILAVLESETLAQEPQKLLTNST